MTSKRGLNATSKLLSFCVIAAGLGVGLVSRAHAGGPCPFIEESSTPPGSCTWYVQSGAPASVDGGVSSPFNNLAQVQAASNPGDTIIIVAVPTSVPPLDGGIVLQAGQTLAGGNAAGIPGIAACSNILQPGPTPPLLFALPAFPVITSLPTTVPVSSGAALLPRITNTSATGNTGTGDAVTLAPNTTVKNLVIGGADAASQISRGAIYGLDAAGNITITCNDVSFFNTSGAVGFIVQPFYLESYTPGMANHNAGIKAGWAGIMLDAATVRTNATISNNYVHDGVCGDGIDLRNVVPGNSDAYIQAILSGNYMAFLLQCRGPNGIGTLEGIATQTEIGTTGTVVASLVNNVQNSIGSPGANADSLFVNPAGNGPLTEKISNHLFLNGIGGASTNGLEYIIAAGHNTSFVYITNSVFQQDPGDMLELFNRGNDGTDAGTTASLIMNNVVVQKTSISNGLPAYSTPPGGVGGVRLASSPDNTGECLGIGSVGGGDVSLLQMTNTSFTGCGNNGLEVTNNYATGDGPPSDHPQTIVLDIINSRISGSHYYNLWVNNISPLTNLNVKVQNSDLSGSTAGVGVGFDSFFGYAIANANIDLGGGPMNSTGNNCFFPRSAINDLEATTTTTISGDPTPPAHPVSSQYMPTVFAEHGWWGGGDPTFSSGATNVPGFQVFTTQPGPYATIRTSPSLSAVPLCGPGPGSGPGPQQLGLD
ncbi:MAG TPA: hypothetical protein VGF65_18900 [Mycobacterium sp.]